ncbi:MAG: succinate dehydrogenase/fumarate reductase flavoprotein subunit, partial [Caldisphaera sp.]
TAECLTSGRITGELAAQYALSSDFPDEPEPKRTKAEEDWVWGLLKRESGEPSYKIKHEIQETMSKNFYVFRDSKGMSEGLSKILELRKMFINNSYIEDKGYVYNTDLVAALETMNLLDNAFMVAKAALNRTESRGAHFRTDYPKRDDENWLKHTIVIRNGTDDLSILYSPVTINTWKPVERKY